MSLGLIVGIAILIMLTLNLVFLIAFIGPILTEFRLIASDFRKVTDTVERRVAKIDEIFESVGAAMEIFRKAGGMMKKVRKSKKTTDATVETQS